MTLKNSISALCPLACLPSKIRGETQLLVRQSLLIISAKRWHWHIAEGHMGLRADHVGSPTAEKLHLAVGASTARGREGDGGAGVGLDRSPPRGFSSSACASGAELWEEQQRYDGNVASAGKEAGVMQALCEDPRARGKWGGLRRRYAPGEMPCCAAMQGSPVKPHPYLNTIWALGLLTFSVGEDH